jgi:hypothetical protein
LSYGRSRERRKKKLELKIRGKWLKHKCREMKEALNKCVVVELKSLRQVSASELKRIKIP